MDWDEANKMGRKYPSDIHGDELKSELKAAGLSAYGEVARNLFQGDMRAIEYDFFAPFIRNGRLLHVDMDGRSLPPHPEMNGTGVFRRIVWPVDDGAMEQFYADDFRMIARVVAQASREHMVLVTCAAGLNRSGVVVSRALMYLTECTPDHAIQRVRAARGPHAMSNPHFTAWLQREGPSLASDLAAQEKNL